VEIGPPLAETLVTETWDRGIGPEWVPFGEPRPEVVRDGGAGALWNHGDSSFESGVYSRRALNGAGGLGIEASISNRLTTVQWQTQTVALDTRLDGARLAAWDHRTGAWPGQTTADGVCSFAYPDGEGARGVGRYGLAAGLTSGSVAAPPDMSAGGWHTLRVQLFADGRCGFAVDGVPVWISPEPVPRGTPFRLLLQGRSHGTRVLVGPVEAWTGVREDIDWRLLGEGRREKNAPVRR
jgi:hypothetical protein